jgi:hypothetical protein
MLLSSDAFQVIVEVVKETETATFEIEGKLSTGGGVGVVPPCP